MARRAARRPCRVATAARQPCVTATLDAHGDRWLQRTPFAGTFADEKRPAVLADDHIDQCVPRPGCGVMTRRRARPRPQREDPPGFRIELRRRNRRQRFLRPRMAVLASYAALTALSLMSDSVAHDLVRGVAVDAVEAPLLMDVGHHAFEHPLIGQHPKTRRRRPGRIRRGRGRLVHLVPAFVTGRDPT